MLKYNHKLLGKIIFDKDKNSLGHAWQYLFALMLSLFAFSLIFPVKALALEENPTWKNNETGFIAVIEDDADLLTDEEEGLLLKIMSKTTDYGNAYMHTTESNYSKTAEEYAKSYLYKNSGYGNSGTVFLIDMNNRMLYIFSDGFNYSVITNGRANTITDNVYRDASREDYYSCTTRAFGQINTLLEGGRIAQPMKYISNGLLALLAALIINFSIVAASSSVSKERMGTLLASADVKIHGCKITPKLTRTEKRYSPVSKGSGGGSGGGRSGGGGGGGRSGGGGGGGHRF